MTSTTDQTKNYILRRRGVGEKIGAMEEFSEKGLKVVRSDKTLPQNPDYVFRWGTTATIPMADQTVVVNPASAIHWAYDKRSSRKQMADLGLSMRTWIDFADLLTSMENGETPPSSSCLIVRPEHHIRSLDLNVCHSITETYKSTKKYDRYYISEYIKKDAEWRVFVVQGRVVAVVQKIPVDPNEVSWGCVEEGQFRYVPWNEWPLFVTQKAVQAFLLSGLDFGAVDVISRSTGLPDPVAYVLEINTAPELTPYYMKTFVKCFDYIIENGKNQLPITNNQTWKHFIHPAVSDMAVV